MTEHKKFVLPDYKDQLFDPKNIDTVKLLVRSKSPYFSEESLEVVPSRLLRDEMNSHITSLNDADIWISVLQMLQMPNRISPYDISHLNAQTVRDIAQIGTVGVLLGQTALKRVKEYKEPIAIKAMTINALEQFPNPVSGVDELIDRTAHFYGVIENEGTFAQAIKRNDTQILAGQDVFFDLLRVYGSNLLEQNSLQ